MTAIGIIYIYSPRGIVINRVGEVLQVKRYTNGGFYVRDGKTQISYGSLAQMNDEDIEKFVAVFCEVK